MGIFSFFHSPDINAGVAEFHATQGAVLLDVRSSEEYQSGHIAKSVNIPLDKIGSIEYTIEDRNTPIFVYCLSGGRSARAVAYLQKAGYTNVKNIGGISAYRGKAVR
ncbi:MAG: rhodanese-like domain-containing protein [Christensenellaceae bacterium]